MTQALLKFCTLDQTSPHTFEDIDEIVSSIKERLNSFVHDLFFSAIFVEPLYNIRIRSKLLFTEVVPDLYYPVEGKPVLLGDGVEAQDSHRDIVLHIQK
jgi:hypothetical protein